MSIDCDDVFAQWFGVHAVCVRGTCEFRVSQEFTLERFENVWRHCLSAGSSEAETRERGWVRHLGANCYGSVIPPSQRSAWVRVSRHFATAGSMHVSEPFSLEELWAKPRDAACRRVWSRSGKQLKELAEVFGLRPRKPWCVPTLYGGRTPV